MNLFNSRPPKKTDPVAIAKARALIEEIDIADKAFRDESRMRVRHIEADLEDARHELNVLQHDIAKEAELGAKRVIDAAHGIVMPEDDEELAHEAGL